MFEPKEQIQAAQERWEQQCLWPVLQKAPERDVRFMTTSSEPIDQLYTPLDLADSSYTRDIGHPGEYPFTRGVHPTRYRGKLWTMRMFAGFGTAEETNERYKYLLEHGETGLSVAFDMPTLYGYDTDAPDGRGRVRQVRRGRHLAGRHGDPLRRHPASTRSPPP